MNEWIERLKAHFQNDELDTDAIPEAVEAFADGATLTALEADDAAVPASVSDKAAPKRPRGPITGVPLDDLRCLLRPFTRDPFFSLRPPLDLQALRLSLELSEMTYELSVQEWMRAGWTDVSIQVDNTLQSGVTASVQGEQMQSFVNAWKLYRARSALKEHNPIAQIAGALRQREKSDTIKAVTMLHKTDDGRYVVALGFMGTGSRFYDWFSNLRFSTEEGFHKGFYQLSDYFTQNGDRIFFPDTAAELGLESLTLADIVAELKSPSSRFVLWMAGHSQGGAVMQIYTHTLIRELGALPQNLVGYGFASPSAAGARLAGDPAAYPLYHVLNTDDMVPKVGALQHLGFCLQYQANDPFRAAAYGWEADDEPVRAALKPLALQMTDTLTTMECIVALLNVILREKADETIDVLSDKRWSIAPIDRLLSAAGDRAADLLGHVVSYTNEAYHSLTGHDMDENRIAELEAFATPIVREQPMMALLRGLYDLSVPPHMIMRDHHKTRGAYAYIAMRGYASLRGFVWESPADSLPQKRFAERLEWVLDGDAPQPGTLARPIRRPRPAQRRTLDKKRPSLSARKR